MKVISVPFFLTDFSSSNWSVKTPHWKLANFDFPSLIDSTVNEEDKAFTALVPTPFKPTDFLNALESYLPPVFIFETTSISFPNGIPLP